MSLHQTDRIRTLDLIRGVAVLGILAVNVAGFAAPWPDTKINRSNATPGEYGPIGAGRSPA